MKTLRTIVSTLTVAWLAACAPTATITQNSKSLESDNSAPVTAPANDTAHHLIDVDKMAVQTPQMAQDNTRPPWLEKHGQNGQTQTNELARLQARIAEQWEEYKKKRPRRVFVGSNVQEPVLATYVNDWVKKVERVGNLHYPEAARRDGIYGKVQLTVSILPDGIIQNVVIDRTSGSKILDEAAIKTVHFAAPYAPFSEEMRKKVDVLSITRTWTFTRSDRVDMSNDLKN